MPFELGPVELGVILLIVAMLFGVGKLPEVFGSIGKGVREFRKEAGMDGSTSSQPPQALPPQAPVVQDPAAPTGTGGTGDGDWQQNGSPSNRHVADLPE